MSGSVSMNKHVCLKRYEPSNVSVRCGTHFFIYLRILWIPKSQHTLLYKLDMIDNFDITYYI